MKRRSWLAGAAFALPALLVLSSAPIAHAALVLTTYEGIVTTGEDYAGLFGAPLTHLTGAEIRVTYLTDDATPGAVSQGGASAGYSSIYGYGAANPVRMQVTLAGHDLFIESGFKGVTSAAGTGSATPGWFNTAIEVESFIDGQTYVVGSGSTPFPWDYHTPFFYQVQASDNAFGQFNHNGQAFATYRPVSVTVSDGSSLARVPAVASLSGTAVNFGTVRPGTQGVTGSITITNTATGFAVDALNVNSAAGLPPNVSVAGLLPTGLDSLQSGAIKFALDTSHPGAVEGAAVLKLASANISGSTDLPAQQVGFTGTVTQPAQGVLVLDSGAGVLSGGGTRYVLDLGLIQAGTGPVTADLGVLNAILGASFSETLGGSFAFNTNLKGFKFSGSPFSDLVAGATDTGNLITFNSQGLFDGAYADTIILNGFSRFASLGDLDLAPITLTITARVFGGAVPEPSTWALMLIGFGGLGAMMRRRRAIGAEHPAEAAQWRSHVATVFARLVLGDAAVSSLESSLPRLR